MELHDDAKVKYKTSNQIFGSMVFILFFTHLCQIRQKRYALHCFTETHLICQNSIDAFIVQVC